MIHPTPSDSPTQPSRDTGALPYFAGLDGLRALAVIAVILYHADLPVHGGFLGVEVFFVLSGFLITALLAAEWRRHNQIDVTAFWIRRVRRLLPALFFMLLGTVAISALVLGKGPGALGADILSTLGYVMNWRLILGGQSYFDPLVRPSLLQHLWSLAVEEQFYLLWPLLFAAGMRRLRPKGLLVAVVIVAVGSLALMAALHRPGADPSRVYYGTDTRIGGMLIGAALALIWAPRSAAPSASRWLHTALDATGLLALSVIIAAFFWLPDWHPLLYPGGFALIDIVTVLVIVALTLPGGGYSQRLLGFRPLQWIGVRSYGLYLWHWPIFMVTRPFVDLPLSGLPLLALRLVLVALVVEISYRFVELPVRRGAIEQAWQRWCVADASPVAWLVRSRRTALVVRSLCLLLPVLALLGGGAAFGRNGSQSVASRVAEAPVPPALPAETPTSRPVGEQLDPEPTPRLTAVRQPRVTPTSASSPASPITAAPASTATPTAAPPQPLDPALAAQLQALLDQTVTGSPIPGATLSVHVPGYLPWDGSSGLADRATGRPMEPVTPIYISSITKMFTAVVVLQLAEEGQIDLDAPIATYLPGIVPLAERTTVRHLLSQQSGILDYLEDSRFFIEAYQNPDRVYTPDELVGMVDQYGAAFEPGEPGAWKYSSTNYVILGVLVEHVTGRPMADEMRDRIFEPLSLNQTFFAPDQPVQGTVAQGYIDDSDRADVSMTFVFATGNIISTAVDLRRFADGLFGDELLSEESLQAMTTMADTGGAYGMPELEYGLGVMQAQLSVGPAANGDPRPDENSIVWGHIGGIAGSRAAVWHVPQSGITIALGVNQANVDPNLLARDTLDVILNWQEQ